MLRLFFNALMKSILDTKLSNLTMYITLFFLFSLKHQVQSKSSSLLSRFLLVFFLMHQLSANHAPSASVVQGIWSVHTLRTFQWIHTDPSIIIIIITIIIIIFPWQVV